MMQKLCLFLTIVLIVAKSNAQNQQILYDFDQLPQTLLLNPGAEVDYDKHFGVPLLSNFFLQVGATNKNINYNNIISGANGDIDILRNIFEQDLNSNEIFLVNQQLEILNGGLRLRNADYYLSFGMYQEIEGFANYPKDEVDLFFNGNDQDRDGFPEEGDVFNFNQLNFIGELVGVFHIGITKKINEKLNIGARFKLLSGSLQLNSINNQGEYQLSANSSFNQHNFDAMRVVLNTSGFIKLIDDQDFGTGDFGGLSQAISGLFFGGGNLGAGLDLGFTYHFNESITLTGSLIDLDFITYTNKVVNYSLTEDFILSENNNRDYFDPEVGDEFNYWDDKFSSFYDTGDIPLEINDGGFNFRRSPKLNASIKYQFNHERDEDYNSVFRDARFVTPVNESLISEVGIHTYTDFKPNYMIWAVTAFYMREITKGFKAKVTYTYDKFSSKNIGLGISTHFRDFNFYATADNLLALPKLKDSNYQSFQLGMNFIFY
ncbi:MAG: DUF5723 family protein [Flavobacteriaceae bacterium]|nr:DUF5723 family protein [Flavobacteriaceae bacterium]